MKIAIGADHRGTDVRSFIVQTLTQDGHEITDMGPFDGETCDYPDIAFVVASTVSNGEVDRGVLVCGTGIGMSMAANKVQGIRAALVHDEVGAELSRRHNDANVLCLSADMLGLRIIDRIVRTWLTTEFEGGRHARRVAKITAIESTGSPAIDESADDTAAVPE